MKKRNNLKDLGRVLAVLSLISLNSCASNDVGQPLDLSTDVNPAKVLNPEDDLIMSLECWAEVEWQQCDIVRRSYSIFNQKRWADCPDWSCNE